MIGMAKATHTQNPKGGGVRLHSTGPSYVAVGVGYDGRPKARNAQLFLLDLLQSEHVQLLWCEVRSALWLLF